MPILENPFPGLRPFGRNQHHLFFGRESQVHESLERLHSSRFLAVVGPSGSGKSSLIHAGLIPGVYAENAQAWRTATMRPGEDPVGNLERALSHADALNRDVVGALKSESHAVAELAQQAGVGNGNQLLLFVDQFEELFRNSQDESSLAYEEAARFVKLLLDTVDQSTVPIYVLLTMRADFLGFCTRFDGLPEAINDGQYLIPRMTRVQMQEAIIQPVAVCQAAITPNLVTRLMADLEGNQDQLPVMQHALMRTWDYWVQNAGGNGAIQESHYDAVGTIKEALSHHAEEVYAALPSDESRRIAQVLFKNLTDRASNNRGLRRSISLREVCAVAGASESEVMVVADHFRGEGRWFITPESGVSLRPDTVLDLVHECLMRVWTRLQTWVEEEGQAAQLYLRLANTAALYQDGRSGLYQGPDLELALNWYDQNNPTPAWAHRYDATFERAVAFLEHSKKERDFELATQEARQKRQIRRARVLAIGSGAASLIFLLLSLFALDLFFKAEENRQRAEEQQRVAEVQRQEAELARQEAIKQQLEAEAQRKLAEVRRQEAEQAQQEAELQRKLADAQRQEAESQRQRAEARRVEAEEARSEAEQQRQLAIQQKLVADSERQKAERLRLLSVARALSIQAVKLQRNDQVELGALLALQAYLFNERNGGPAQNPDLYEALRLSSGALSGVSDVLRSHDDGVRAVAFTPDSKTLISGGDDGRIYLWPGGSATSTAQLLVARRGGIRALSINVGGTRVGVGNTLGEIFVQDLTGGESQLILGASETDPLVISGLAFSANGRYLAGCSLDGQLWVWDVANLLAPPVWTHRVSARIQALAFSPVGDRLAWGEDDGQVTVVSMDRPTERMQFKTQNAVRSVCFSSDGQRLAAGTTQGNISVWQTEKAGEPIRLIGHTSGVTSLQFMAGGTMLVSGSLDKTVRIWDANNAESESVAIAHDSWVWGVALSPEGDRLASGSADRSIRILTMRPGKLAAELQGALTRNLTDREWRTYVGEDIPYERTCPDLPDAAVVGQQP